jgi:riboflavin kinase / FMN adenylyltransferase
MRIIHDRFILETPSKNSLPQVRRNIEPAVFTIGMFDGVHLGHQKLIRSVVESARSKGWKAGLVTFSPHPRRVMEGGGPLYITTNEEKLEIFNRLGLA